MITEKLRFSVEAGEDLTGEVDMIFVANDPRGYEVHLTNDCWHNHILVQHPIMKGRLSDVKSVIVSKGGKLLWKKP